MIKPLQLLDNLSGGNITIKQAGIWYGKLSELLNILIHLEKDKFIQIVEIGTDTGRKLEEWEIAEMKRSLDNGEEEYNLENIWIVLTEEGARQVS